MKTTSRGGFTLVEVSLAVLVVGLGLLAVFSLFPSGLRSAADETADTRCSLFAGTVLNGMRANAAKITSWTDWNTQFGTRITQNLPSGVAISPTPTAIPFPANSEEYLRYRLTINTSDPDRYSAYLEVRDGRYGDFGGARLSFYTEFIFTGDQL